MTRKSVYMLNITETASPTVFSHNTKKQYVKANSKAQATISFLLNPECPWSHIDITLPQQYHFNMILVTLTLLLKIGNGDPVVRTLFQVFWLLMRQIPPLSWALQIYKFTAWLMHPIMIFLKVLNVISNGRTLLNLLGTS